MERCHCPMASLGGLTTFNEVSKGPAWGTERTVRRQQQQKNSNALENISPKHMNICFEI